MQIWGGRPLLHDIFKSVQLVIIITEINDTLICHVKCRCRRLGAFKKKKKKKTKDAIIGVKWQELAVAGG